MSRGEGGAGPRGALPKPGMRAALRAARASSRLVFLETGRTCKALMTWAQRSHPITPAVVY